MDTAQGSDLVNNLDPNEVLPSDHVEHIARVIPSDHSIHTDHVFPSDRADQTVRIVPSDHPDRLMVEPESIWDEKNPKMAANSPLWSFWSLKLSEDLSHARTQFGHVDHPGSHMERPAGVWIIPRASLSFPPWTSTTIMNLDIS
ncbi:hypothetical protein F2Q70_00022393 [Brassica cretica]|uniref:Uncharacterized protein n=1 Tax=Brassica cretica TaxID=69181 RepID=A0A8S9GYN3_BRACR|nr:hypothetical protein F2Q70_00022393 [Brassica cretica]KAF2559989.1 hypothetical protein F2Q68_00016491 [Brassica cretica]